MLIKIAPSILSARFEMLGDEVRTVEAAGADQVHIDVMDGHFVPNISMGPVVVEALRRTTRLPLDVHLMITDPGRYLEAFVKAGAHHVTFHTEVTQDPVALASWLRERRVGAGLALNPDTPVERVLDYLPHFDTILVMTVRPGFGGQAFMAECLDKVRSVRETAVALGRASIDIMVDGGVDPRTALLSKRAGANVFVAGNSVFASGDAAKAVRELRNSLKEQ